ncbi:MAG: hypothetical protein R3F24_08060 [Gammaproteobacteria bacterium]
MDSRPNAFDVIVLADTLVYFGKLDEALRTAKRALAVDGVLAFALELQPAGGAPTSSRSCTDAIHTTATTSRLNCIRPGFATRLLNHCCSPRTRT